MRASRFVLALALLAGSSVAMAHPGHGGAGFGAGFIHPFSGLDHVMAMIAVGLFAMRQSGSGRWVLPGAFLAAMVGGALLGAAGVGLPLQEAGIAASLLVFGLAIAFLARAPLSVAVPMVAFFGLFHGGAHFAEMGHGSLTAYVTGFAVATVTLHAAGMVVGGWMPRNGASRLFKRALGAVIAGTGLVLLGA
ncbi:HupE/UreJ family protein [Nitrogeniibacter mangrovi]|uniref:HupE/UreJ family protein n=1 Tax=Nitrogeniibacter mangrovi TaxID=2016596 RepID=A0A6C1B1T8_9RHOO|nr:HupE/UreJ family protein [Nitrogeniibacter mangrovi]QID16875.1 HupE/UreJ family protein [Nitrogeniibacter mangrovi]